MISVEFARLGTLGLIAVLGLSAGTRASGSAASEQEGGEMKGRAIGTFQVQLTPQASEEAVGGTTLGRILLAKQLSGDLEGSGEGEMLTAMTAVEGSAAYVAIERVRGTLDGRPGSFVLQHRGTMDRGAQQLEISIVPDSGTDELTGISGTMTIAIDEGRHSYVLEYTLPAKN